MSNGGKPSFDIVSEDLEDHLEISEKDIRILDQGLTKEKSEDIELPEIDSIRALIESGDRGVAKEAVIESITYGPRYLEGIERLVHSYEEDKRHMLFSELLREGGVNYNNLIGYLDRVAREYISIREKNPETIEVAISDLLEEIGAGKESELLAAFCDLSVRYYSIDPVKTRDICLSFYRSIAKFNPHVAKSYFGTLKNNMLDDRILRIVIRDSRRDGELALSYECAAMLGDKEWSLYLIREIIHELCSQIEVVGSEGFFEICRHSSINCQDAGWAKELLRMMAGHSLVISEGMREILEEDSAMSDSEVFQAFLDWHGRLPPGTELVGEQVLDTGSFSESLQERPLYQIPILISRRVSEENSEELLTDLKEAINYASESDHRRARELVFHGVDALLLEEPSYVIELIDGLDFQIDDERVIRRVALANESIGEFKKAISATAESENSRTRKLHDSITQRIKWLEEGYDLNYFEKNESFSPINERVMYAAHSCLPFITSGYTIRTHYMIKELVKGKTDISVFARWGFPTDRGDFEGNVGENRTIEFDGVEYNFDPDLGGNSEFKMEEYVNRCAESMMRKAMLTRPSIIHSASDHTIGIASAMVSKSLGIPFVYEMRGIWALSRVANNPRFRFDPRFRILLSLERQCAEAADIVITLSDAMKEMIAGWGIKRDRIVVVPNGVSAEEMAPVKKDTGLVNDLGIEGKVVFGYIGSIVPYEGLGLLVEALGNIPKKKREKMRFIIVGDGTDRSRLESMVMESDLEKSFIFTGRVPHDEIGSYYSIIDAIVLPRASEEVCELVPALKPLEAMSMGKTVVCSDISPAVELIRGNFNGLLFRKDDSESLAEVILEISENLDKFKLLGERSRDWVKENRNWSKLTEVIEDTYMLLKLTGLAEQRGRVGEITEIVSEFMKEKSRREFLGRLSSITGIAESTQASRTARNVFLGILRGIGLGNTSDAIEYGERFIGSLGDYRSVKSMTTFYKRMGISEDDQRSLMRVNFEDLSDDFEEIISIENRKIRIRESPYLVDIDMTGLLEEGDSAGQIFAMSGSLICSSDESYSAALVQFEFFGKDDRELEGDPGLLSKSGSVGWYSYLNRENDGRSFLVEFSIPEGTERILAGIRTWNNIGTMYILPDVEVVKSSLEQYKSDLESFANSAKSSDSETVVFMFSGTTFVQEVRANRPIRLTTELTNRGIPVIFNYHRWNRREEVPEIADNLIQIPIDVTERLLEDIAELDFGDKRKLFVVSYPHPSISKILNRYRVLGWSTIYDARDEWEEFHKVGQAKWFKTWNEKYIVHNVDHVTSVSWPLAEKLDEFGPANPVEVLPNALSPHFLSENYMKNSNGDGRIGYFGHLTDSWFDWDSLIEIAKERPGYKFEIIGHSEPDDLILPDNISILGPKTHPEINEIAASWDVAIIPFKVGKLSDAVDPIKIYEYLALGLPTVSFRMPQIDNYPYTRTVANIEEFCESLDFFLLEQISQNEIEEWLGSNTWGDRVDRMLELSISETKDGITSVGE